MEPTREEIEQFRSAVIAELKKLPVYEGKFPQNYEAEIEVVKNYPDDVLLNAMEFNTPKEYAETLIM